MKRLEARALCCSRGPATLFRDVSFGVGPGEWLAVRGANGSGKTTLLRCIAGLTRADAGEVLWQEQPVAASAAQLHADMVFAGHLPGIKDDLSAEENLHAAMRLRGLQLRESQCRDALREAGLERRRHLPARRLSAGQRRRIGLARLMLDPATLWVLDEPLTALDDEGRQLFERLLSRHLDRGGVALLATHHDLAPAPARVLRLGA